MKDIIIPEMTIPKSIVLLIGLAILSILFAKAGQSIYKDYSHYEQLGFCESKMQEIIAALRSEECFPQPMPEEHGKEDVARLSEVQELAHRYGSENIKISALYYDLIEDKNFVKRLIGEKYKNVDCIIPVEWPEGKRIYIEVIENNEEHYLPVEWQDFENLIAQASQEDRDTFFANINDDQKFVRKYLP